jgi:ABC-type polysaccharide/polyol phosphate transport system ATPase subunit
MTSPPSDWAIRLENLSKAYTWYASPSDALAEMLFGRRRRQQFDALSNITLDIGRGEVVGIIGRNGAGKSTLLKLIAGTISPTAGAVSANGRVSAILELGTGFHGDRTGRENVVVSGLCLGFSRAEIKERMDEIIAFSELGDFIDRPLKTYSTGMKARLAFAVATAVDPDILIVDEALSVGDAKFERKSFARFEEYRAKGKTILFVTHTTGLVEMVCDRALYLQGGKVRMMGAPKPVVAEYMQDLFGPPGAEQQAAQASSPAAVSKRYGTGGVELLECGLFDDGGQPVGHAVTGGRYRLKARAVCHDDLVEGLNVGLSITNPQGVIVFAINPVMAEKPSAFLSKGDVLEIDCAVTMNLGVGDYFVTVGAWAADREHHYDRRTDVVHFTVIGPPGLRQSIANLYPDYRMSVSSALEPAS